VEILASKNYDYEVQNLGKTEENYPLSDLLHGDEFAYGPRDDEESIATLNRD